MLQAVEIVKVLPDGSQWGRWSGYQLPVSAACTTIWTPMGTAMHWKPGTWHTETYNLGFFWPTRWYVISAKYTSAGLFAGCYCDIVTPNPPVPPGATTLRYVDLRYVDLYIDVVVSADHQVITKDEEVYDRAAKFLPELVPIRDEAFGQMMALAAHARAWSGPFRVIPERLICTNWEEFDPQSSAFAEAMQQQWGGISWEN